MADNHTGRDHVFIIRLWKEPKQNGGTRNSWRGRVTELASGSETHFVNFSSLMGILKKALGIEQTERTADPEPKPKSKPVTSA